MKKLLVILLLAFSVFTFSTITFAADPCTYDVDSKASLSVWDALNNCLEWAELINWTDVKIDSWFATQIKYWINNVSLYLWILAVWSIVFGSLMMTLSAWEEEKIKKAKDIIKWGLIWFIWLISASSIINLVVKIMYSI